MKPDRKYVRERLAALGLNPAVADRYGEDHRVYHNWDHLLEVCAALQQHGDLQDDDLFLAAVYHDAVYDPRAGDNEQRSAALFREDAAKISISAHRVNEIDRMILDTTDHKPRAEKSDRLIRADLNILDQPFNVQLDYEYRTFREFQFVDFKKYPAERIKILESVNKDGKLDALLAYVRAWIPKIGVFCGSFNPFHRGHYNVLEKAEKIFDKVIIAFGRNLEKDERSWEIPTTLQYRQIESYSGLLTDFVSGLGYPVVVIRGLRNSTDFQYEQNQYRYIQELMPGIRIVNIFCDKEFEHISSSGIRTLEKFGRHHNYLLS